MRITKKTLQSRVDRINEILDAPVEKYTVQEDGKLKANIGHFCLSQAYGGYCLHKVTNEGGGVTAPLRQYHAPAREVYDQLCAFIDGLEYSRG